MIASNGNATESACLVLGSGDFAARTQTGVLFFGNFRAPAAAGAAFTLGAGNKFSDETSAATARFQLTSVTPKSHFSGTYQLAKAAGQLNFNTYSPAGEVPLTLAAAAGTYVGPVTAGTATTTMTLTLKENGQLTAEDQAGHVLTGVYQLPDATRSLITFTAATAGGPAASPSFTLKGIALLAPRPGSTELDLTYLACGELGGTAGVLVKRVTATG